MYFFMKIIKFFMKIINFFMKMGSFFSKIPYFLLKLFKNRDFLIYNNHEIQIYEIDVAGTTFIKLGTIPRQRPRNPVSRKICVPNWNPDLGMASAGCTGWCASPRATRPVKICRAGAPRICSLVRIRFNGYVQTMANVEEAIPHPSKVLIIG